MLSLGKVNVWGVSDGGGYLSTCARWIPDQLSAAVTVSGAGHMDSPEACRLQEALADRLVAAVAVRFEMADIHRKGAELAILGIAAVDLHRPRDTLRNANRRVQPVPLVKNTSSTW